MQSSTFRRLSAAWRGTTAAALAAMVFVAGNDVVAEADRAPADDSALVASTIGAGETEEARTPPPPQRLTSSGLRPLGRAEADRLRGDSVLRGVLCEIDFDDDAAMALLPGGALDTFAYSPWWIQLCSNSNYARVRPTDTNHLHVNYVDATIDVCINPQNPYDTPVGMYSRGEDCEPIDPVTEPRSFINVGHYANLHGRLYLTDAWGSDYTPRPFTLERMRILSAPARVCYRMPPEGPWVAAEPVGPFDEPGLVYCWSSLSPGLWDLSGWTSGTVGVDFTGASDALPGYDDFRLS